MNWAELLVPLFNVLYVVIAILMTVLILLQRGAGAQAGSSFGAGASGTVFGAQGSANFLSRSTSICAVLFFAISIGMGIYIAHGGRPKPTEGGFMGGFKDPATAETATATPTPVNAELPAAPGAKSPGATSPGATGTPTMVPAPAGGTAPSAEAAPTVAPAAESVPKPIEPTPDR